MPIINTADPINAILLIGVTVLLLFLAKETKKSAIMQIALVVFLVILVIHAVMLANTDAQIVNVVTKCLSIDFGFIAISYFSYLWIDEIEAKEKKKKTINSGLDWFWKKV